MVPSQICFRYATMGTPKVSFKYGSLVYFFTLPGSAKKCIPCHLSLGPFIVSPYVTLAMKAGPGSL